MRGLSDRIFATDRWGFTPLLWVALVIGVALRVISLDSFPPPMLDEGGWPLSVREWATEGLVTYDFHTAPGYHVILGAIFELAEPTLIVARRFSALLSVVTLGLFWWTARRLVDSPRTAAWATVLWATCFPAIDIGRRALIEPIQMLWLIGLLAALTMTGAWAGPVIALLTAGLLLTKANAIALLPVFAVAVWWDSHPAVAARTKQKWAGLGAGLAVAALGFVLLYLSDPGEFARGWGPTMEKPSLASAAPLLRAGRFVLDPVLILDGIDFLATQTPFLLVLGSIGALRAVREREQLAAAGWLLVFLPFLLVQVLQSPQYFSVLYPAMALCAATLLTSALRSEPRVLAWPTLALALTVGDGLGRSAGAMLTVHRVDAASVAWLRENVPRDDRVIGAPFLLMQLESTPSSLFRLGDLPWVPTPARVAQAGAQWVVIDRDEWRPRLEERGFDSTAVADTLRDCCALVHSDAYVWVYRVRPTP